MEKYKRNYAKWDDFTNKYPDLARIMNLHNIQEFTFIGNSRIYFTKNGVAWNTDLPGLLSKADLQKYFTKHTIKKYTLIKQLEFASLSTDNKAIIDILAKLTNNKFIFEMDSENRTTKIRVNQVVMINVFKNFRKSFINGYGFHCASFLTVN